MPRNISHNVVEISDPFGPAIVDPDIGIVLENNSTTIIYLNSKIVKSQVFVQILITLFLTI